MPSGHAYGKSFRTVKTCVGSDFCRFGLGDSTQLGIDVEQRYQGLESPAKMKLAVSGCPRNCAESYVKDVGIVAVEGGRWEVYVGGAAGATVRKGDLLATVDSRDDVVTLTGRFMQYYRENATWLDPHRGGPLADGLIDGALVVCPLHNHAFRLADGQCTTGEWSVQAYPVAVEDGEVVLRLAR